MDSVGEPAEAATETCATLLRATPLEERVLCQNLAIKHDSPALVRTLVAATHAVPAGGLLAAATLRARVRKSSFCAPARRAAAPHGAGVHAGEVPKPGDWLDRPGARARGASRPPA